MKAARYAQSLLAEMGKHTIKLVSFEGADIPMIGRDEVRPDQLTAFQKKLTEAWAEAELVVFTVPEYNWITSGELINAMHQLGTNAFAHLFENKVFALIGVSNGRGGRRPCLEIGILLNKLISFLNRQSVVSPKIFESHETQKNLDEKGVPTGNRIYDKGIADFLTYSLSLAERWHA